MQSDLARPHPGRLRAAAVQALRDTKDCRGRRAGWIVEDVVSTGGQIVLSTEDLRAEGAEVRYAIAVVDRQTGGREALAAAGLGYRFLFTSSDLAGAIEAQAMLTVRPS